MLISVDLGLVMHCGFTDEELDFIINYDIKYRMGKSAEGEEYPFQCLGPSIQ